jgi:hypothetical protein
VPKQTDFASLHDLARHAIHTSEVMAVTVDTITDLVAYIDGLIKDGPSSPSESITTASSPSTVSSKLHFWLGLQKNIFRRSQAIEKRFTNEIQLVSQRLILTGSQLTSTGIQSGNTTRQ